MGTVNPRPRGGRGLTDGLHEAKADRNQIRRLVTRMPKPEKPAAGTLGGFTRATAGTVTKTMGGLSFSGWSFDTTYDMSPAEKPRLVVASGTSQTFDVIEAGFYFQRVGFFAQIAETGAISMSVNNSAIDSIDPDSYAANIQIPPLGPPQSGRYTFQHTAWLGPFWLPGSAASGAGRAPFRVQIGWPSSNPDTAFAGVKVDIIRGG